MWTSAALLACALGAAALPQPSEESVKIPYHKERLGPRADGTVDGSAFLREINATLTKYHSQKSKLDLDLFSGIGSILKERNNEPLTDEVQAGTDELYYGPIQVSGQTFSCDFDTGSADLFVPGPQCTKAKGCTGTVRYDQSGQSQGKTTSVTYGSGMVSGANYFDTVSVAGLTATHANLISLANAQGFSGSAASSLMGMGFSTISNSKEPTWFESLMAQGKAPTKRFAFHLGRAASGTQGTSELTVNGVDRSRFTGAISKIPVTTKGYWQLAVGGVSVNGGPALPSTQGQAAIDTGTTVILAPTAAVLSLIGQIPGAVPVPLGSGSPSETIFAYPCGEKFTVSFIFGGKKFAVNPLDLSIGQLTSAFAEQIKSPKLLQALDSDAGVGGILGGGLCVASIIGADLQPTENLYVVGDSFLKNWYSVYDYNGPTVGFAKSK